MRKKLVLIFAGLLVVASVILLAWYQIDGIPVASTEEYLSSSDYSVSELDNGSLLFEPIAANGHGIVIMHGALILPKAYVRSAAFFAARGFTVYLPRGPGRLSVGAADSTAEFVRSSALNDWFFIGHSMGGLASLTTITAGNLDVKAVGLWATSMPSDFSDIAVPILFIWGDTDGLLPEQRFASARENLPPDTEYVVLGGANHKNFALYSHQFFDNQATLDWLAQIDFANERTLSFFQDFM